MCAGKVRKEGVVEHTILVSDREAEATWTYALGTTRVRQSVEVSAGNYRKRARHDSSKCFRWFWFSRFSVPQLAGVTTSCRIASNCPIKLFSPRRMRRCGSTYVPMYYHACTTDHVSHRIQFGKDVAGHSHVLFDRCSGLICNLSLHASAKRKI